MSFLRQIPKLELHAHLSGCIRKSTFIDLLKQKEGNNADLSFLSDGTLDGSFTTFSKVNSLQLPLQTIRKVTRQILQDFASDNVKYLELRATPKVIPPNSEIHYITAILQEIENSTIIDSRLILSIDKAKGPKSADKLLQLFDQIPQSLKNYVVGVDLGGYPGSEYTFRDYQGHFQSFRQLGLKSTIHIGELGNERSMNEIQDVLLWKPDRIGHLIYYRKEQLDYIEQCKIPIEVCLSSNISTTKSDIESHPVKEFVKRKIPISICTDDTLCFNTTISQELQILQVLDVI